MKRKIPASPFATRLSGSAKETELRLRSIFQWKKKRPPVVFIVLAVLAVTACGGLVEFTSSAEKEVDNSSHAVTGGTPVSNLVIAEGETVLKNNAPVTVRLVMGEGTCLTGEEAGFGGGFADKNYVGRCELQVWRENTKLTDFMLENVDGEIDDMLFSFTGFSLQFDDYNGDGDPDFTVGQYGTGNFDLYSLFSVDENAEIRMISDPYDIPSTDGKSRGSMLLTKMQGGFTTSCYDNSTGETRRIDYTWNEEAGRFLQKNDTQTVLDYVDAIFASGDPRLRCFLLPGTGPISAPMDDYNEKVRDLFSQYTWVRQEGPMPELDPYPDGWTMYLTGSGSMTIEAGANSSWITVLTTGEDGPQSILYSAEGGPGDLALSLIDLWNGPSFRYALVTLPESITDDGALAGAYADAFRALYLNSGAITDYELHDLEVLSQLDESGGDPSFRLTYSVRPADPEDPGWQDGQREENGWVTFSVDIHMTLVGNDSQEEMVWCCSWWEYGG